MPNPSRSRLPFVYADARLTMSAAALALILAAPSHADPTKVGPLPAMPEAVIHFQTATTKTATTTAPKAGRPNWAAPPPLLPTTNLYDGEAAAKSRVSVVAWGGGSGGDTTDISYGRGGHAIKIVTHGLYEGVKMNFNPPVTLGDQSVATNRTFQMLVRFGQSSDDDDDDDTSMAAPPVSRPAEPRTYAVSGGSSMLSDAIYTPRSGWLRLAQGPPPGAMYRGRRLGGQGYPGALGYPRAYPGMPGANSPRYGRAINPVNSDANWDPPVHYFRLLFTLQNGAQAEIIRPTPWPTAFEDPDTAWLSIGVPLSLLKFGDGQSNSPLASITIGGDGPATFYIGQINLVNDNAPISCSAGQTQDVAAGDDVTFTARSQGGVSMLKYSWDFDASDGIIDEAEGAVVTHSYTKGDKDYTATLTVSDLDGIKKPCTSTVKIKVEE